MRKLKLQVQTTIDGFIAGPGGEMDWMEWNWDDALRQFVTDLTEPVDCIVLGRKLAEGFIPHWEGVAADNDNPEQNAGKKFTDTQKVVFTKTIESSDAKVNAWPNTVLAKDELAMEINKLKNQPGGDIIAYGGAEFVASLIRSGLIDEYYFFINPAAIGNGLRIFHKLEDVHRLRLSGSSAYDCGIVVMSYVPR